jgi:mono/diheme cytochrome c family protein
MPPRGGGSFTEEQLRSIAAYVYSVSHGNRQAAAPDTADTAAAAKR